jgi:hypothetical protein
MVLTLDEQEERKYIQLKVIWSGTTFMRGETVR